MSRRPLTQTPEMRPRPCLKVKTAVMGVVLKGAWLGLAGDGGVGIRNERFGVMK